MAHRKIPPDWHYISEQQSELWRAVAAAHAPSVADNDPVARAYQELFQETAAEFSDGAIHLVGIGAGSGRKERRLAQALASAGCEVRFTAVDVSEALASEAARMVGSAIDGKTEVLVGDFRDAGAFLLRISDPVGDRRHIFTGFGLSPNLLPEQFFPGILCLLDAEKSGGAMALVSANLCSNGSDAERELLSQYDNTETRQWLGQLFVEWGLTGDQCPELDFCIGEMDGIAVVQAFATWPELDGKSLESAPPMVAGWRNGDRVEVFSSLRYTTENFAERAEAAGMMVKASRSSVCGREAVFLLERKSKY